MSQINENTALQLRDNAQQMLMSIKSIEGGVEYLNKVRAIEVWAKAERKDAELQNIIAEQKIRTQRVLGRLIREGQERGELASQKEHGRGIQSSVPEANTRKTDRPARARIGGKTTEGGLYDGRNEGRNYGKNELWGYFWGYL